MSSALRPYPAYKPSGVEWLGDVPKHWEAVKLRRLVTVNPSRSEAVTLENKMSAVVFLPMEKVSEEGRIDCSIRRPLGQVRSGFPYFRRHDVIVAKITPCFENGKGAYLGALETEYGYGSTEFVVLRAGPKILPKYLYLVTKSPEFRRLGREAMIGAAGQQRVPVEFVKEYLVRLPPPDEQAAIVRFLDHMDARIRRYIQAKRRLIALLTEQKQAIIHQAVTQGLDPSAPRKPSGVEWLGEIPAHWEVVRAKYLFREVDERSKTGNEELLSVSHLTGVTPRSQKNVTMFMAANYIGHKVVHPGDLAINTMWAWMGALGVAHQTGIVSPSYGIYTRLPGVVFDPDFLDGLLRTRPYVDEYIRRSTGIHSSRLRLYPEFFLRIPILYPPLDEQRAIADHVREQLLGVETVIQRTLHEIDLIREYRTRLITDVVTGQLDVRCVALPDLGDLEPAAAEEWEAGNAVEDDSDGDEMELEEEL